MNPPPPESDPRADGAATSRLEELLVECLDRIESGGGRVEQVLDEMGGEHPDLAAELAESVRTLVASGLIETSAPAGDEDESFPTELGDFRLVRRLGRGGMGVVFLAEQRSLGRLVALKLVRLEEMYFERARARFRREADAIARLSHPGIVAIHAVGEEKGIPYLAMEYVRGVSLDRVIDALENPRALAASDLRAVLEKELADGAPLDWNEAFFRGSWSSLCLRIVRMVAEALEHAHRRGVLHRDVKPSNVMVTPAGHVLLLDFGLASLRGADRMTRSGALLGSLPYMAPEQIEGPAEELDARTDVYGLGVTLYELLTLRAPYLDRESSDATRARVLEGRPIAPRKLFPGLEVDAQTVCLTAMDRDRERRYASAAALAGDLTHVLERRPIAARPAGAWVQLSRWARRRPGGAAATALALGVVTLGPTFFALQESWARERIAAQASRAERNFERAERAVSLIAEVALEELEGVPMAQEAQRRLLEASRSFYAELLDEPGSDRGVLFDRARALVQLANLQTALGDPTGACANLAEAIASFEELGVDARDPLEGLDLCRAWFYLSHAHSETRATQESMAALRRGIEALSGAPEPTRAQAWLLARMRCDLGVHLRQQGDFAGAREELTRVIEPHHAEVVAQAVDGAPIEEGQPGFGGLISKAISERALLNARSGMTAEGLGDLREAVRIGAGLQHRGPTSRGHLQRLLTNRSNLGGMLIQAGELDDAEQELRQALVLAEELVADYPQVLGYRYNLGGVLVNLGGLLLKREDRSGGRAYLGRAVDVLQGLVDDNPENLDYRTNLMAAAHNLAALELAAHEFDAALARLDGLEDTLADLTAARPGDVTVIQGRIVANLNRLKARIGLAETETALAFAEGLLAADEETTPLEAAAILCLALDPEGLFGEPEEVRSRATDLALRLLARAIELGYDDPQDLQRDSFEPLGADPRYRALLEGLEQRSGEGSR